MELLSPIFGISCFLCDTLNIFDGVCVKSVCIKLSYQVGFLMLCPAVKADPVISVNWVSQDTISFLNGEALFLCELR